MVTLGDKSVGDIVKIKEDGVAVNYLIVHKGKPSDMYDDSCDGVWVLREKGHSKRAWHGTDLSTSLNDYENSDIAAWLNGDFLNTIDEKIREAIKTVKIPYRKGSGDSLTVQSGANGLSCKTFLLSGYEVGFTQSENSHLPLDGAKLSYFSDNNSRIAKDSSDNAAYWWLRSPNTNGGVKTVFRVFSNGSLSNLKSYYSTDVSRPAFVLPYDITINDDGSVSTECTKASINLKNAITSDCIVACTLKVNGSIPDDAICNYEVTNNANDSVPVWEDCTNESKAGYPYVFKNKTSENGFAFSFRVSIERGSSNVSGYISSVSGGFKC